MVRQEADHGPGLVRVAYMGYRSDRDALLVALEIEAAVHLNPDFHPGGQGVHDGYTDAMETARHLVVLLVELSASVETGHDEFEGGDSLGGMDAHGDAPSVVLDPDDIVLFKHNQEVRTIAHEGFVYRVVHHFVNEVVETIYAR